jgi:hypothetical protein
MAKDCVALVWWLMVLNIEIAGASAIALSSDTPHPEEPLQFQKPGMGIYPATFLRGRYGRREAHDFHLIKKGLASCRTRRSHRMITLIR